MEIKELKQKKRYLKPLLLEINMLEMEDGIAAGSAKVEPINDKGFVQEEWIQQGDVSKNMNWY